jgi:WD40 repeat protein
LRFCCSPDGSILAAGVDHFGEINFWRTGLGKAEMTLKGQQSLVSALTFSPGGTILASGHQAGDVTLWNVSEFAKSKPKSQEQNR